MSGCRVGTMDLGPGFWQSHDEAARPVAAPLSLPPRSRTMELPRQRSQADSNVLGRVAAERLVTSKNLRPPWRVEPRQPERTMRASGPGIKVTRVRRFCTPHNFLRNRYR